MHQPPWSFGFDSQTRGTRENRRTLCSSTGFLTGPRFLPRLNCRYGEAPAASASWRRWGRRAPFSTDTASHTRLPTTHPFRPRRAHSPTAFSGPMARPPPSPRVLFPHPCTQDGWFLQPKRRPARLPRRTIFSRCICRCSRMRRPRSARVNPIPNPDPNPNQAQKDVAERGSLDRCALIGKPVCGGGVCVGGVCRAFYYTYTYS